MGIIRMPGESVTDWQRRVAKTEGRDPDLVGPATNGPRFAGETQTAWEERLANHDRNYAPWSFKLKTDDDSGDDDS
jgi:hypothetical protein